MNGSESHDGYTSYMHGNFKGIKNLKLKMYETTSKPPKLPIFTQELPYVSEDSLTCCLLMSIKKVKFKINNKEFTDFSIKTRGYFLA